MYCLALSSVDLTSPAGEIAIHIINIVAQFKCDLPIKRTQAGRLSRMKARGKPLRKSMVLSLGQQQIMREKSESGETISAIACQFKTADRPSCVSAITLEPMSC